MGQEFTFWQIIADLPHTKLNWHKIQLCVKRVNGQIWKGVLHVHVSLSAQITVNILRTVILHAFSATRTSAVKRFLYMF